MDSTQLTPVTPQEAAVALYADLSVYSFADRKKVIAALNRMQREALEAEAARIEAEAKAHVQQLHDLID